MKLYLFSHYVAEVAEALGEGWEVEVTSNQGNHVRLARRLDAKDEAYMYLTVVHNSREGKLTVQAQILADGWPLSDGIRRVVKDDKDAVAFAKYLKRLVIPKLVIDQSDLDKYWQHCERQRRRNEFKDEVGGVYQVHTFLGRPLSKEATVFVNFDTRIRSATGDLATDDCVSITFYDLPYEKAKTLLNATGCVPLEEARRILSEDEHFKTLPPKPPVPESDLAGIAETTVRFV